MTPLGADIFQQLKLDFSRHFFLVKAFNYKEFAISADMLFLLQLNQERIYLINILQKNPLKRANYLKR